MAQISASNITSSGFTIKITGLENPQNEYDELELRRQNQIPFTSVYSPTYTGNMSGYQINISGILAGTTYICEGRATYNGTLYNLADLRVTTLGTHPKAKVYAYFIGNTEFSAKIIDLQFPEREYTKFELKSSLDSAWYAIAYNASSTDHQTKGGLKWTSANSGVTPNTTYTIHGRVTIDGTVYNLDDITVTTGGTISRPPIWNWSSTISSNGQFNISATEWNNFLQNIRDVYAYKGLGMSDYPLTNATYNGLFYASMFNEAKYAIGSLNSTGIADKERGDILYASDFQTLRSHLNAII